MRARMSATLSVAALIAAAVPAAALSGHPAPKAAASGPLGVARDAAPVVLTGAQIPQWAQAPAEGLGKTYPAGTNKSTNQIGDNARTAHNGTVEVPPVNPAIKSVDPSTVAAYSWVDGAWKEIRVQVDERFPYFLANGRSSFSFYSGTDEELTYAWGGDGTHSIGEESWKKMFGECASRFAASTDEVNQAKSAGFLSFGPQETASSYLTSMADPQPLFDTDDELAFQAGDAGGQAPTGQAAPAGASNGEMVTITDPLDPSTVRFVYLFTNAGGSSYTASNGYVQMSRTADSEEWIDRYSYAHGANDAIGISNTGYGPNLPGTVCRTSAGNDGGITTADGVARPSTDRNPRDGFTVRTSTYELGTLGRWLVNSLRVAKPVTHGKSKQYGANVIARWKGRAFQQSPDSSVSLVGFEDEQVNWEMNSALLGWRVGPVRGIREVWGADSGTNVTKTETYYRDADTYAYHVRVHPIPADGLYTDWSYRPGVATTYYNLKNQNGVAIDGQPDNSIGEFDQLPVTGQNVEINSCDPTFAVCSAMNNPEEIAGKGFGLVYEFELTGATAAAGNAAAVPYYRDDACFDDGTGDAPAPRPWPGETSTDPRVHAGYLAYWQQYWDNHPEWQTFPRPTAFSDFKCQPALAVNGDPTANSAVPPWQIMPFSGAIGEHGVHFFFTQDSDNTFGPKNTDEVDGQQWRFEVPMATPTNVLVPYGANVTAKLVAVAAPLGG
ncbi:MAG: hypothetical protein QOG34_1877 [Frankiaceae bacterium]|nr:hypothetical protein [Frankiaceae bacterium]